jgi:hypothetical protein
LTLSCLLSVLVIARVRLAIVHDVFAGTDIIERFATMGRSDERSSASREEAATRLTKPFISADDAKRYIEPRSNRIHFRKERARKIPNPGIASAHLAFLDFRSI